VRIALLSINACSQGLTLTAASTVVFAEMTWTPSIMTQAEDRAHRISQQNCVNVYYLYGPGTVDDIVFRMIDLKSEVVNETLDGTAQNFQVSRKSKNDALDEVKKAHKEGTLNPVIVNRKKTKTLMISSGPTTAATHSSNGSQRPRKQHALARRRGK